MRKLIFLIFLCSYSMIMFCENKTLEGNRLTKQEIACIEEVFFLISDRLEIAFEIAKWKWNHRIPIDIKYKNQSWIKKLLAEIDGQIDSEFRKSIIISQINAEKSLQIQSFEDWVANEVYLVPAPSSDLLSLEEQMREIDIKIIRQLKNLYPISSRKDFFSHIVFTAMEIFPKNKMFDHVQNEIIRAFLIYTD